MPDDPGKTILDNIVSARRRTLEETRSDSFRLNACSRWRQARQERRDFAAALASEPGGCRSTGCG